MKIQYIGIFLIIILLVGLGGIFALGQRGAGDSQNQVVGKGEKFRGTITSYDTGCFADGVCSVTIDDKVVVTTIGFRVQPELGRLIGVESLGDFERFIGSEAEVYAEKQEDGTYTLYGDSNYYVKVEGSGAATTTPVGVACTMDAKICPDGTAVGRVAPSCEFAACPSPTKPTPTTPPANNTGSCYIGGCSSQICSDDPNVASTCEFKEEYACYRTAKCERQPSGQCGWTPSSELSMCVEKAKSGTMESY